MLFPLVFASHPKRFSSETQERSNGLSSSCQAYVFRFLSLTLPAFNIWRYRLTRFTLGAPCENNFEIQYEIKVFVPLV